jgi:group I intron endonuclease
MIAKKISGIYEIRNKVNGKVYIGQSVNVKYRNTDELNELRKNVFHNYHLQNAWNKYGEENFKFSLIERCNEKKLNEREIYHVRNSGYPNRKLCYNLTEGGKSGKSHPEIAKKLSETRKRMYASGELIPWMKGKTQPKKTREKISKSHTGKKRSLESRQKQAKTLTGRKRPEHSKRMSGQNNPTALLSIRQVLTIKILLRNLKYYGAIKKIASIYNVKPYVISRIKKGETWNNLNFKNWRNI